MNCTGSKAALMALIFLFFIQSVSADLVNDFNAVSSEKIGVCGCSVSEQKIGLANGDFPSVVSAEQSGTAAKYATLAQASLALNTREKKSFTYYIVAPCGVDRDFELKTTITNEINSIINIIDNKHLPVLANSISAIKSFLVFIFYPLISSNLPCAKSILINTL